MKRVIKIIICIIIILLIFIFYISYLINHNNKAKDNIEIAIKDNYQVKDNITYTNQYGNYYIIKTTKEVIVLNKSFEEIAKDDLSNLKEVDLNNDYELIYKTKKLMYEKTTLKNNKLIYKYYDVKTLELLKTTTMEKQ